MHILIEIFLSYSSFINPRINKLSKRLEISIRYVFPVIPFLYLVYFQIQMIRIGMEWLITSNRRGLMGYPLSNKVGINETMDDAGFPASLFFF